jgi:hypothetical protein
MAPVDVCNRYLSAITLRPLYESYGSVITGADRKFIVCRLECTCYTYVTPCFAQVRHFSAFKLRWRLKIKLFMIPSPVYRCKD